MNSLLFMFTLTDKGFENYQLVLNDIFAYIRHMRKDGVTLEKYKELRQISLYNLMFGNGYGHSLETHLNVQQQLKTIE